MESECPTCISCEEYGVDCSESAATCLRVLFEGANCSNGASLECRVDLSKLHSACYVGTFDSPTRTYGEGTVRDTSC